MAFVAQKDAVVAVIEVNIPTKHSGLKREKKNTIGIFSVLRYAVFFVQNLGNYFL